MTTPTVPPTVVQIPSVLGDAVPCTVIATPFLNLRATPSVTAAIVGKLNTGVSVIEYPSNHVTELTNVFVFVHDAAGNPGWCSQAFLTPVNVPPMDMPIVMLGVPYYSQLAPSANLRINDCLVACCRMMLGRDYRQHNIGDPLFVTVNDMTTHTPLVGADKPLPISAGITLLAGYGITVHASTTLDQAGITAELKAGRPCSLLVNDHWFGGAGVGHFVVPVAFGTAGFWVHDPDHMGASFYITFADLNAAQIAVVPTYASTPFQGIILAP